ncbi:MAG: hypothetical protein KDB53_00290 [Planctomycetes bacterium]|nr:hypothetical protein [Planctomycetota bacterium]
MVDLQFDEDGGSVSCEGCGTEIPAFLEGCPYCEDEGDDTLPCPSCGQDVHEDSQQCPHCGAYVTMRVGSKSTGGRNRWLVIAVIALMILALIKLGVLG